MRAYLFLLLLGFIFAYNCKLEHISVRIEGRYSSFLFWDNCACPAGTVSFIETPIEKCYCYRTSEIQACKADKKCQTNSFAGCVNKNISDYGKK